MVCLYGIVQESHFTSSLLEKWITLDWLKAPLISAMIFFYYYYSINFLKITIEINFPVCLGHIWKGELIP